LFYDNTTLAHQMPQASAVHHITDLNWHRFSWWLAVASALLRNYSMGEIFWN
jgi:hypothetical protein